ncbi:STAS/SEC14 domain-containing protein [Thalassotalea sp. LPB0316]|uniref:STAS/SEC14 domain-containing protein n=1 Tax=Thalassotalea sp. LPB0316 TaxID=2769490 RepID=UPI001865A5C5|nr:STAS/SEC14 domain-containing protein [Thalassotalea sp. LPB0316]QOL24693.1 STAS/SEC14 domain-containing protein [Thalassotalea sp. LPB0316]
MLHVTLQPNYGIAILEPDGALSEADFLEAKAIIDPYIAESGGLKGVMIYTKEFPGWESFNALLTHLSFVQEHHKFITKVALVTDSVIGNLITPLVTHFVSAKVQLFAYEDAQSAKAWLLDSE